MKEIDFGSIDPKQILFFVGAGISRDNPSNIPLGAQLTKFVLDRSCGEKASSVIEQTWTDISEKITGFDKQLFFPFPRLETIMGCIDEIDSILNRYRFLSGVKSWVDVLPNSNHIILADFLKNGSNIITTNFDLGIQNAYKEKYSPLYYNTCDNISVFSSGDSGSIFHIHGCSFDDIDILGATIENVKRGFSGRTEKWLLEIINSGKVIVFLGYSMSDSFDVIPFLKTTIHDHMIIFVQHISNPHNSSQLFPINLDSIFSDDNRLIKKKLDTNGFLKDIAAAMLPQLDNREINTEVCFDWEKDFKDYSEEQKIINLLGLRYHVGIATEVFVKEIPSIVLDFKNEYEKANRNTNSDRLRDYYEKATRSFTTLKKVKYHIPKTVVNGKVDYIDKSYLIRLRDECEYYIQKYRSLSRNISSTDNNRIKILYGFLKEYANYTYKNVQYISYLMACLKYISALSSRANLEHSTEYAYKELLLAMDISYIEGAIAALIHLALHEIYYCKIHNQPLSDLIHSALSTAFEISVISGYEYHIIRINGIIKEYSLPYSFK